MPDTGVAKVGTGGDAICKILVFFLDNTQASQRWAACKSENWKSRIDFFYQMDHHFRFNLMLNTHSHPPCQAKPGKSDFFRSNPMYLIVEPTKREEERICCRHWTQEIPKRDLAFLPWVTGGQMVKWGEAEGIKEARVWT